MKKLVVDLGKCTGCRMCQMMCSLSNEGEANYEFARIRISKNDGLGLSAPAPCRQCIDAPCHRACPVEAIVIDPNTGAKVINYEDCIVCESCVEACPFGAITVIEKAGETKVVKCNLCNGAPKCVGYCETGAIKFIEAGDFAKEKAYSIGNMLLELTRETKGFAERV